MRELGIYIHIPFCKSKCYYCDFISYSNKDMYIDSYIQALKKEIVSRIKDLKVSSLDEKIIITTMYIGGGTPSYIDAKYIKEIIETVKEAVNLNLFVELSNDCEITIECNPGTVNKEKIEIYKNCGINRISMGLQSVNNCLLKQIGRIHTFEEFLEAYTMVRNAEIKNVNVDLMLGLPNQSMEDLINSVKTVIELNPEHISVYSLIVEEGTKIEVLINNGIMKLPEDELERKMYWKIKSMLEEAGYIHYEISNFAKPGYESRHNSNCWKQKDYLGFGTAAHSYYDKKRFSNTEDIEDYIKNIEGDKMEENTQLHEIQEQVDTMNEYMLLNLRKLEGVNVADFKNKFRQNPIFVYKDALNRLVEADLVEVDMNSIKLTAKGLDLANQVWEEFV